MNNIVHVRREQYETNSKIRNKLLESNIVSSFFKFNIKKDNYVLFDVTGYKKIKDYRELTSLEFLNILELMLQNMEVADDYLIFINMYHITKDTVFVKSDKNRGVLDVKFLFTKDENNISEKKIILNALSIFTDKLGEDGKMYKRDIEKYLMEYNPSYIELIKHIEHLKDDIKTFEKY